MSARDYLLNTIPSWAYGLVMWFEAKSGSPFRGTVCSGNDYRDYSFEFAPDGEPPVVHFKALNPSQQPDWTLIDLFVHPSRQTLTVYYEVDGRNLRCVLSLTPYVPAPPGREEQPNVWDKLTQDDVIG